MLLDKLTNVSFNQDLTAAAANTPLYSAVLDISSKRDIGVGDMPTFVVFNTPPTSATSGATINAALQGSNDATFATGTRTMEETGPQVLTDYATSRFLFRGHVNKGFIFRYYRYAFTVSAALTTGSVTASFGAEPPRSPHYDKNYTV